MSINGATGLEPAASGETEPLARGQGLVVVALPMVVILARVLNLEALNVHSAFQPPT
jgi:hypothetical protein